MTRRSPVVQAFLLGGLVLPLLGACTLPLPGGAERRSPEGNAAAAACRAEAERVLRFRDRGQQMREDEADSRVGVSTQVPTVRAETDRLGARFERDRMVEDCLRGTGAAAPADAAPNPGTPNPRAAGRPRS
jgi:hypothetical protein